MANELSVVRENWLEISDKLMDLPQPFSHDIFLQECHVAGTMHIDDILVKTQALEVGSALMLQREPDNGYDELAIAVLTTSGDRVGYVPRKYNQVCARLMDAGKLLVAKVAYKELEDHWLNLRMEIYLRDI